MWHNGIKLLLREKIVLHSKTDKLTTRLLYIFTKLNEGKKLSVKELAKEFNVTERSVQKDFYTLAHLELFNKNEEVQQVQILSSLVRDIELINKEKTDADSNIQTLQMSTMQN